MSRRFIKDALGWGFVLWLIGYALGILFFAFVPVWALGFVITPIGVAVTLWVLFKKIKGESLRYYAAIGVVWLLIAILCDYIFLVLAFAPADGYYKFDVYLYYALTLLLPVAVGWWKSRGQDVNV